MPTDTRPEHGDSRPPERSPVHEAFARVLADIGPIAKNQRNVDQGYAARSIDDLYDALHDVFARHGLICLPRVLPEHTRLEFPESRQGNRQTHVFVTVEYDFYSADGSGPLTMRVSSEGKDAADKATNKAMSGAIKYGMIQAFQIPVSEQADPDLHTVESVANTMPMAFAKQAVYLAANRNADTARYAWDLALRELLGTSDESKIDSAGNLAEVMVRAVELLPEQQTETDDATTEEPK